MQLLLALITFVEITPLQATLGQSDVQSSRVAADSIVQSTIQGAVRASGTLEPVASATVTLPALRRTVLADQKGYFVLADVPAGRWRIEAAAPGYATHGITIESTGGSTIRLDFELDVQPIALTRVDVDTEAGRAGGMTSAPGSAGPPAARLEGTTLRHVPGLFEADVLRALQILPSVAAMSDYSSALYVRGGSADQNLIALDGVPLFNPYHVGGLFSAIGADAVSSVDIAAGAFPARGGDRLSSLIDIHTRDGGRDEVRTSGALGLLSAHTTVDGPLPGGRGTFLLTGRKTWLDVTSRAAERVGLLPFSMPYGFSDLYAKATHPVASLGSLTLSGYLDSEGFQPSGSLADDMDGEMNLDWGSRMLSLTWRQPVAGRFLLEARAGYSGFHGNFHVASYEGDVRECDENGCRIIRPVTDTVTQLRAHSRIRDVIAGADLTWFRAAHTLRAGLQLDNYLFDHALTELNGDAELLPLFDRRNRPVTMAAYVEDEWSLTRDITVRGGVRVLDAGALGTAWMPRVGLRWQATPALSLSAGAGSYAQVMHSLRNDESVASSFFAYDLIAGQPHDIGLARARDVVLTAVWRNATTLLRIDAFERRLRNLVHAPESLDPLDAPVFITEPYRVATGGTRGLEIMASHRRGRAEFGLAYALTSAERTVDNFTFAPRFDRRHRFDASASLALGRSGILSTRLTLASGQPYTPVIGATPAVGFDPATGKWLAANPVFLSGMHNSARLPGYVRFDVAARKSFDKRWFGQSGTITPYIQIINILNTPNALIAEPVTGPRLQLNYWPQLPILPTFGIEWRF
jgi:hypothetical protein